MNRVLASLMAVVAVVGSHAPASAQTVAALSGGNLVTFSAATPGTFLSSATVTGLNTGETLFDIDYRPADGALIGFGYNADTGTATVYSLDIASGVATDINTNTLNIGTSLTRVTADFNPTANALRVVTNGITDNNFRVTAGGTGTLSPDTALNTTDPNLPNAPSIRATAYSRNVAGGGTDGATTLYAIDGANNSLVTQGSVDFTTTGGGTSPNSGTLFRVAQSGITASTVVGFDILSASGSDAGTGYISDGTSFYTINLGTGGANYLGDTAAGITAFAVAPVPVPEPATVLAVGAAGLGLARVVRRRRAA